MTEEQASFILELLRRMRAELAAKVDLASPGAELGVIKSDADAPRSDLKSDLDSGRAALAAVFLETRKDLSEQIDGLRQTVRDCHAMALRVCPSLRRVSAPVAAPTHGRIGS
jgi:phage shock protein A